MQSNCDLIEIDLMFQNQLLSQLKPPFIEKNLGCVTTAKGLKLVMSEASVTTLPIRHYRFFHDE